MPTQINTRSKTRILWLQTFFQLVFHILNPLLLTADENLFTKYYVKNVKKNNDKFINGYFRYSIIILLLF